MFASPSSSRSLNALSDDSKGWLTSCLDPFHDFSYEVRGLPDEKTAPSVVQVHNQNYTLTAPTGAAGGTWDAVVYYTGYNSDITQTPVSGGGMVTATQAGTYIHTYDHTVWQPALPFGALQIAALASTTSKWAVGAPITTGDSYAALGSCNGTDRCRLIGVAIEIHNTTAEIYKQGSLTVAQLPDIAPDSRTILYWDTEQTGPYTPAWLQADQGAVQAQTVAALRAVPGSQTWSAAEGVYAIPRMVTVPRDTALYGQTQSTRVPVAYGSLGDSATPDPFGYNGGVSLPSVPRIKTFAQSGFTPLQVFMNGLSNQTTLTISFRTIVEYFPACGSVLLPLAEPSPVYDPLVFGMYSAIIKDAPYAVPVNQNAGGEYFKKIMRVLAQALDLTSPMFGQFAPLVAAAAKVGQRALTPAPKSQPVAKKEAGSAARQTRK